MWSYTKRQISQKDKHYDIVILGDSGGKSMFKPKEYSNNSYAYSIPSATPISVYYTLETMINNNNIPNKLIISFRPYLLEMPRYWNTAVLFNYISLKDHIDIIFNLQSNVLQTKNPFLEYFKNKTLLGATVKDIQGIKQRIKHPREKGNKHIEEYTINTNGHAFFGTRTKGLKDLDDEGRIKGINDFKPDKTLTYYLNKIVELARENNIDIYWYSSPINSISCEKTSQETINKIDNYIQSIFRKEEILKLSHCLDHNYFGDQNHIYTGADMITEDIIKKLNNIK